MRSSVTHLSFACIYDVNKNIFMLHVGYFEIFWVGNQGGCCSSNTSGAVYQGCDESNTFQGIRNYENWTFQNMFIIHKPFKPNPTVCFRVGWAFSFPKQIMAGYAGTIQKMEALLLSSCSSWCCYWGTEGRSGFCLQLVHNCGCSCLHPSGKKSHIQRKPFIDLSFL